MISISIQSGQQSPVKTLNSRTSWKRLRSIVSKRDNYTCVYCGRVVPDGHVDHILPLSKGGTDSIDNLAWTCSRCNIEKSGKTLRQWVDYLLRDINRLYGITGNGEKTEESCDEDACEKSGSICKIEDADDVELSEYERVRLLHQAGFSKSKISQQVYGYAGGAAYRKVASALDISQTDDKSLSRDDRIKTLANAGYSASAIAEQIHGYANGRNVKQIKSAMEGREETV